jgi:D-xylose transport system permease protein
MKNATATNQNPVNPEKSVSLWNIILSSIRQNIRQYMMILVLIIIWIVFTFLTDFLFLTPRNLSTLFIQSATIAILAIGMVLIIVTGHIDLSVGSVLGFTGAVAAFLMIRLKWDIFSTIAATLFVGLLIGLWHGYWVANKKVPAFIVTLASMMIFRGGILGITGGQTQGLEMAPTKIAEAFKIIGQNYLPAISSKLPFHDTSLYFTILCIVIYIIFDLRKRNSRIKYGFKVLPMGLQILSMVLISLVIAILFSIMVFNKSTEGGYHGIPYCVLLVMVLALVYSFIANNTTLGRHLYAIGGNPDAAKLSGINVRRRTMTLFMMMGVMTAIAGIVYTSRLNAATTSAGTNAELDAIASAVIGGTSLMGGEGTIIGAVIGALVMASLDNGMSLMNMDITIQYITKGLMLLLAVFIDISTRQKA